MDIISYALSKKGMQQSVSDYLDEHLTNPTNPPLDTSLTIANAAADSKATGDKLSELKEGLSELTNSVVLTRPNVGTLETAMDIAIGDVIKITTSGTNGCQVRLRATSGGTNLQILAVPANSVGYMLATVEASYISVYFGGAITVTIETGVISSLEMDIGESIKSISNVFPLLVLEQGGITSNGEYRDLSTRLRTVNTLQGQFTCYCPAGYQVFGAYYFDHNGYIVGNTSINSRYATVTVPSDSFCKLVFCKDANTSDITVEEIKSSYVLEDFNERIDILEHQPMVEFTYDHDLYSNVGAIVEEKQYTRTSTSMSNIYFYFDALVDNDYVTKVDLASELGISYPVYANGVATGDATYDETPAYKTYMYKFICSNNKVNSSLMAKKKIILVGGTHGDEAASPFNLYIFAQRLVNDYLTDENIFKLRAACDIYIVPCLNGYGMIHMQRTNANGVDLNRNFPIHSWYLNGEGTSNYTGPTAGSEFETQLIIALVNSINPSMVIDHHNYSYNLNTQFYTDMQEKKQLTLAYQALTDLSIVCKRKYPQYFGNGFDFVNHAGSAPSKTADVLGYMSRWCYEQHIPLTATIEIGDCITYNNGTHAGQPIDYYGADTFKVAEYTLRNQLLHYGQWVLNNA